MKRALLRVAVSAALLPASVHAQPLAVEFGGFAQPTFYDPVLTAETSLGFGGRLGIFVSERVSIEGEGSYSFVDVRPVTAYTYTPVSLRALYHRPTGHRLTTLVGIGAIRTDYRYSQWHGVEGLLGVQYALTRHLLARVDGTVAVNPTPRNTNTAIRAGLSMQLGRRWLVPVTEATDRTPAEPPAIAAGPTATPTPTVDPAPVVAPAPAPKRVCTASVTTFAVQVGAFEHAAAAEQLATRLRARGSDARIVEAYGDGFHRVRIGRFETRREAAREVAALKRRGQTSFVVTERETGPCGRVEPHEVRFGFDQATVSPTARAALDAWIATVPDRASARVRIDGHADQTGPAAYNTKLSRRRAEAVRRYLVAQGFTAEHLTLHSLGETEPVDTRPTAASRANNRRADVSVSLLP